MRILIIICVFCFSVQIFGQDKTLFVYGGQITKEFISYTAKLTQKEKPKILFLPTASADRESYIEMFQDLSADLNIEASVMKVWISAYTQKQSWEEVLTSVDAIIVGGGNTLNMIGIWKAQEIDKALKKAYEQGVILAGGSAGSLCWFNEGMTDSRPRELTKLEGLGFLDYSHSPHYHFGPFRRGLYHQKMLKGELSAGYACDDKSGIVFVNGKATKSVSLDDTSFPIMFTKTTVKSLRKNCLWKLLRISLCS